MTKDILYDIVSYKKRELEQLKEALPEYEIHQIAEQHIDTYGFEVPSMRDALVRSDAGIIAEFKRKSPSKGWIKENGKAYEIPLAYQNSGAAAISILTDTHFFGGSDAFVSKARQSGVTLPVLYKNFIVDEYQLFQARICGASAVLLIAAVLSKGEYKMLAGTAHDLGLEVLLEMHSEPETEYVEFGADMYGVNNRNLGTFITDVGTSYRLSSLLPADGCKVSESGISSVDTVKELRKAGFKGFLIGENFMKKESPGDALRDFINNLICS